MPPDEAIDLITALPPGSRFKGKMAPYMEWSDEYRLFIDIAELLHGVLFRLNGHREEIPKAYIRPEQRDAMERERKRAREVRKKLENTVWKDID